MHLLIKDSHLKHIFGPFDHLWVLHRSSKIISRFQFFSPVISKLSVFLYSAKNGKRYKKGKVIKMVETLRRCVLIWKCRSRTITRPLSGGSDLTTPTAWNDITFEISGTLDPSTPKICCRPFRPKKSGNVTKFHSCSPIRLFVRVNFRQGADLTPTPLG